MSQMSEKDREAVKNELRDLTKPVKLINFTQETECMYCRETRELLEETASLSDKLSIEVYDFMNDKEMADKYGIDKIPATIVMSEVDYGIRFYGIPTGYEFASILTDIKMISSGESGLGTQMKEYLKNLKDQVHLQVFVTPTCPYCPAMVVMAHQMSFECAKVSGDMVEASEFPHLTQKYRVMGVPRTVINEEHFVEGRVPESMMLSQVKLALYNNKK